MVVRRRVVRIPGARFRRKNRWAATDADGRWSGWIDLKVPDYFFSEYYYNRHTVPVLLEVMVNDGNGQAIGAQARVTVHDATLDVSGGLDRYMYKPGETITVKAVTRDIDGQPRANEPVTAKILKWSGTEIQSGDGAGQRGL